MMIIQVGDEIRADQLPLIDRYEGLYKFEWGGREYLYPGTTTHKHEGAFVSGITCFLDGGPWNTQYLGGNAKILILYIPD